MPTLSIIVPVYNTELYIKNCIESILQQSYCDWELILVDDGSTDKSGRICKSYSESDNRIKLIRITNSGQSAARNVGLSHARGELITFIDSDDDIDPVTFEQNIILFNQYRELDVVQYPVHEGYDGRGGGHLVVHPVKHYKSNREIQVEFLEHYNHITSSVCNKIFKKKSLSNYVFPEGRLHEDYVFMDNLVKHINNFYISDKGCYHYYYHNSSTTHTQTLSRHLDLIDCDISRLKRRYEFKELNHLLLEQYIFVERELQNIKQSFPNDDLSKQSEQIEKLKPPFRYIFGHGTAKEKLWFLMISFIGIKLFSKLYQILLNCNIK